MGFLLCKSRGIITLHSSSNLDSLMMYVNENLMMKFDWITLLHDPHLGVSLNKVASFQSHQLISVSIGPFVAPSNPDTSNHEPHWSLGMTIINIAFTYNFINSAVCTFAHLSIFLSAETFLTTGTQAVLLEFYRGIGHNFPQFSSGNLY